MNIKIDKADVGQTATQRLDFAIHAVKACLALSTDPEHESGVETVTMPACLAEELANAAECLKSIVKQICASEADDSDEE